MAPVPHFAFRIPHSGGPLPSLLLTAVLLAGGATLASGEEGKEGEIKPPDPEDQRFDLSDDEGEEATSEAAEVSIGWTLAKIGVTLVAIVLSIMGLGWLVRRYVPGARGTGSTGPLRVVARTYLAPRSILYLVQVGKRLLVVGQSEGGLRTLAEIKDPEEIGALLAQAPGAGGGALEGFRAIFRAAAGSYKGTAEGPVGQVDKDEIVRVKEDLERLSD
ncbi:MAG: flagellar biosynthetic protein FliO [Planctomycetes bacterium]|nr:flagellar biosynthetic protein FliO [Planctomycetota bacterium]